MKKDLSIIIPHYNSYLKLERLIKSIGNQSEVQIIVVDDNSDDIKSINKLKSNYEYVEFYSNNSKNKGAGSARNTGLKNCTGEWIMFADSDDYFLKGALEKIKKEKDSEADIIYFKPTSIYEESKTIANRHIWYENLINDYFNKGEIKQLKYHWHGPWSKMIKKELIEKNNIKFDEIIASNDINFSLKTGFYSKQIKVVNENIYCITKAQGTLTTNISKESFYSRYFAAKRFNDFIKEKDSEKYQLPMLRYLLNRKYTNFNIFKEVYKNRYKIIPDRYLQIMSQPSRLIEELKLKRDDFKYNRFH